jgi:hypothetical protein
MSEPQRCIVTAPKRCAECNEYRIPSADYPPFDAAAFRRSYSLTGFFHSACAAGGK